MTELTRKPRTTVADAGTILAFTLIAVGIVQMVAGFAFWIVAGIAVYVGVTSGWAVAVPWLIGFAAVWFIHFAAAFIGKVGVRVLDGTSL